MHQLSKRFGGTLALDRVDFSVMRGEIHALVGENGAGKSTLIKILAGVHTADAGEISIGGTPLASYARPPIAFIHQDLGLVGSMTVAENIAIVAGYPRPGRLISWRETRERAARILYRHWQQCRPWRARFRPLQRGPISCRDRPFSGG